MKKIVCIILTIVLLAISFTACSGGSNGGENAKTMVDKSIAYLQNQSSGSWKNRIVMIGDAPREHQQQMV